MAYVRSKSVSDIKTNCLKPSLTSYFLIELPFPSGQLGSELQSLLGVDQEKLNLHCADASLPGSSLATFEIDNDRTGVTERHAYRRIFDNKIDLTFYVDADRYLPIQFFEKWMKGIVLEDDSKSSFKNYNYRTRYPDSYMADSGLKVFKFERDYKRVLEYEFFRSYPVSVNSMPLSYEGNDLLRCTVSMSYIRYRMKPPEINDYETIMRQKRFEEKINPVTRNGDIKGTTDLGLTGAGTLDELNRIFINQGFA
jgi:hypothetical protein